MELVGFQLKGHQSCPRCQESGDRLRSLGGNPLKIGLWREEVVVEKLRGQ